MNLPLSRKRKGRSAADHHIQASCIIVCWLECRHRFTIIIIYFITSCCCRCRVGQREKLAEHAFIGVTGEGNPVPVALVLHTCWAFLFCPTWQCMDMKRRHGRHRQEHSQQQPRCNFPFPCLFHGGKVKQSFVNDKTFFVKTACNVVKGSFFLHSFPKKVA